MPVTDELLPYKHTSHHYIPLGLLLLAISIGTGIVVVSEHPKAPTPAVQGISDTATATQLTQLPANFPQVPIYPGSDLTNAQNLQANHRNLFIAEWSSQQPVIEEIQEYFLQGFPLLGWENLSPTRHQLQFQNSEYTTKITLTPINNGHTLTYFVQAR